MLLLSCFLLLSLLHVSHLCTEFESDSSKKFLLFTIKANIEKSAFKEFGRQSETDFLPKELEGVLPDVFRSSFLDNLPETIKKTGSKMIVTEMRKNDRVVASAFFDVTQNVDRLDSQNWFSTTRLIKTYPYWTGNSAQKFVDMTVLGHTAENSKKQPYHRSFYMHFSHHLCETDKGLMGIGESSEDQCSWVTDGGKPPVLFYSQKHGTYKGTESHVGYADRFLVYLTTEYEYERE